MLDWLGELGRKDTSPRAFSVSPGPAVLTYSFVAQSKLGFVLRLPWAQGCGSARAILDSFRV